MLKSSSAVHSVTYFKSHGRCIYCGAEGKKLSNEHVVPFAMGGFHVIEQASCRECSSVTSAFEGKVSGQLWGDARSCFNAPTRRRQRRKQMMSIVDPVNPARQLSVPAEEYPGGFVFYSMGACGLLQGLSEDQDISSSWKMGKIFCDTQRIDEFRRKYCGGPTLKFRHVPCDFGRLIAKIGYCHALTRPNMGDFRPICLPYIMGSKANISYIVGGGVEDIAPCPGVGYSIKLGEGRIIRDNLLVITAKVRLYANLGTPEYEVVVGEVLGAGEITRIMESLGGATISK